MCADFCQVLLSKLLRCLSKCSKCKKYGKSDKVGAFLHGQTSLFIADTTPLGLLNGVWANTAFG